MMTPRPAHLFAPVLAVGLTFGAASVLACAQGPGPYVRDDSTDLIPCIRFKEGYDGELPRTEVENVCSTAVTVTPVDCETCSEATTVESGTSGFVTLGEVGEEGSRILLWSLADEDGGAPTEGDAELAFGWTGDSCTMDEGCSAAAGTAALPGLILGLAAILLVRVRRAVSELLPTNEQR